MNRTIQRADVLAGVTVAFILLPEAMAYAAIAQLQVVHAMTALLVGLLCYCVLGGSRFAMVAPTSSSAALLAAAVFSLSAANGAHPTEVAFALIILSGAGLIALAALRLGHLAAFVSRPVLTGFSFAVAVSIIVRQLPLLLGVPIDEAHSPWQVLVQLWAHAAQGSVGSACVGLGALLLLRWLKRWPNLPGSLLVLLAGIGLAYLQAPLNLQIAVVGPMSLALPTLAWPQLSFDQWLRLAELAGGLLVIVFAESWGSIRGLAWRHGESAKPNRELFAVGVSNLASGLLQGMPVGAGFSASSANEAAGAKSRWSGAVAALTVFLVLWFGQTLIEHIPQPVLAAAVISALLHLLNLKSLLALWRMDRDQYLALAAIAAVLLLGLLHGMLVAIALSLVWAVRSFSKPVVRELAELDHTRNYVDRENHPESLLTAQVLILRPEEPLFFASVDGVLEEVKARLAAQPDAQVLIMSLEQCADLDSTAVQSLVEFLHELAAQNKELLLARVKDPVRRLLLQLAPQLFEGKLFWSVADAVAQAKRALGV